MNQITTFIGNLIASRVLVDDFKIPYDYYHSLRPAIDEVESWAGMFEDLKVDKPHTWVKTGMKVLERVSNQSRPMGFVLEPISQAMSKINYEYYDMKEFQNIIDILLSDIKPTLVWEGTKAASPLLYTLTLPTGIEIYLKSSKPITASSKNDDSILDNFRIFLPRSTKVPEDYNKALKGLGDLFWLHQNNIMLDKQWSGSIEVEVVMMPENLYLGDAVLHIDQWGKFMKEGVRRCVLLQGEPGTGKSTLARHTCKILSDRTLHLTQSFISHIGRNSWELLNKMLQPDVIVIDDIDRINSDTLSEKLYLLEDTYHQVPLTIMTANHYKELPDAYLRPGRIDQIIQLDDPEDQTKLYVLKELAKKVGIDEIPHNKMDFLLEVYKNYSGAYVVEYLRRVKVLGWDYRIPKKDLTFEKIVGFEDVLEKEPETHEKPNKVIPFKARVTEISTDEGTTLSINPFEN